MPDFGQCRPGDDEAVHVGIVVDHQAAVPRGVDVELHRVGAEHTRGAERREGILGHAGGRAAMCDDEGPAHAVSDMSAFLGEIQSFSRMISLRRA